jgi:tetratricopeptide (TPR) repeat protein
MPEQLSNSNHARARSRVIRRCVRAVASLHVAAAVLAFAAWCAPVAFGQSASKPRTAPASAQEAAKSKDAKVKTTAPREELKPAPRSASEITRARRAAAPHATSPAASSATPSAASPASPSSAPKAVVPPATPSAAPNPNAPAEASPVDVSIVSASKGDATKSGGVEAELERLRAEIKDARPGAERVRLQRALVERLVALKREPDALDALRLMIHEDRYDPPFFFNTGNALARLGDASAAEDAYRKAISQRRGNYSRALNNLGVILIRQGHWDEAQETLAAALVQENYTYAEASYNLGRLHLLRGEADLAIREWLRTLRLEPAHAEAAAALARAYAEDGDAQRGINVLDNFVARSTRTGAGIPREVAEARRELVEAANVNTPEEDADAANSKTGAGRGDVRPGARPAAKSRTPEIDRATYDLLRTARAERESGSVEEAVKHYRGVLARSPGGYFPPANLELGAALMNLKRYEEAIAVLVSLTQKDAARYPVAHYYLGRLYERQGQLALSAESFRRAAELYGDANPQSLIDLSRLREQTGDHAGALAAVNDYAAALGRQGTVPAWVAERQAKLRQKAAASAASSAPSNSTPTRQ